jgi:hypothetical protein
LRNLGDLCGYSFFEFSETQQDRRRTCRTRTSVLTAKNAKEIFCDLCEALAAFAVIAFSNLANRNWIAAELVEHGFQSWEVKSL